MEVAPPPKNVKIKLSFDDLKLKSAKQLNKWIWRLYRYVLEPRPVKQSNYKEELKEEYWIGIAILTTVAVEPREEEHHPAGDPLQ